MLMGEYMHTIDTKGRVIMPADFRTELGETFFVTKGLDNCLFIYGQAEWEALSAKLRQLPLAKPEARAFVRFFFAGARMMECDKQGRFLVPGNLRSYANLKKDVVLTGVMNRAELWDKESWTKYSDEVNPAVTEIAGNLADLGI
ncbi:MAG: division/cell wall cluster transcriptional repressor MraZ [Selenomonadaceae bacterium]|nr:division/cell wall cluster transcriptional repressor MraZ [Selenomonadaceae bacterium]MBQ1511692.1 division/cell wall cluster transcriptional repressor MraZ [Selenomonadaceae bacterium]MBQ1913748.1 division/cell wall cluster transcriptional repressor MraZ [Selenomonadaceae bacterium]